MTEDILNEHHSTARRRPAPVVNTLKGERLRRGGSEDARRHSG